jgi:DNA adenine methylase
VLLAPRIVSLLPPHTHYIEPFAGGLSVLFAKSPSRIETVNDVDGRLVNFWRVLRDQPDELIRLCERTPHSRDEWAQSSEDDPTLPDLERARRLWVWRTQSINGAYSPKWAYDATHIRYSRTAISSINTSLGRLAPVARRLAGATIENDDALNIIKTRDHPDAVIYCDPPYLRGTLTTQSAQDERYYRNNMSEADEHIALLKQLLTCKATVLISGYPHPLYDEMLAGWQRFIFAGRTFGNAPRQECVWRNRSHDTLPFDIDEVTP